MINEVWKPVKERPEVTLTTYIIGEGGELKINPRPAVLVLPGGGYFNCSDREAEPVALRFNTMGFNAFVLHYSTYPTPGGQFPDIMKGIEPNPETAYPAPLQDVGCAMKLIRDMSEEWNVDTDRIALCGFSAGAHNAALYATRYADSIVTDYVGAKAEDIRPAAQILGYMLSDYIYMNDVTSSAKNPMDKAFFTASNVAYLGTEHWTEGMLTEISPARQVKDDTCPAFLWATAGDNMVPVQHTICYSRALADHKVPFEMHIFEEGDHGLALANQSSAAAWSQTDPDVCGWIDLCESWLAKRFRLNLPERTAFEDLMRKNNVL